MRKVIAVEIGHWFDPPDRKTKDGWWEFVLNLGVGREIVHHLERHLKQYEIDVIVNSTSLETNELMSLKDWTMEEFDNEFKDRLGRQMNGVLGGIPVRNGSDIDEKVVTGFVNRLEKSRKDNEIDLVAAIAIHFNAAGNGEQLQDFAHGFEVYYQTNSLQDESTKLGNLIAKEIKKEELIDLRDKHEPHIRLSPNQGITSYINELPAPFAYCEFGFYDNPEDRKNFDTPEKLQSLGEAAAKGILNYLEIEWEDEVHEFDHFPTQEEYDKVPFGSLILVPTRRRDVFGGIFSWLLRVGDGNMYYKGAPNTRGRGSVFAFNRFPTPLDYMRVPHNSLIVHLLRRNHVYKNMYRIRCGALYYKKGLGGINRVSSRIFVFDHFPTPLGYNLIPRRSIIIVHRRCGFMFSRLFRIGDGDSYYKF